MVLGLPIFILPMEERKALVVSSNSTKEILLLKPAVIHFNEAVIGADQLLDFADLPVICLSLQMQDELVWWGGRFPLAGALDSVQAFLKPVHGIDKLMVDPVIDFHLFIPDFLHKEYLLPF